MAQIIIDKYDDVTPYGIAPDDTWCIPDDKIIWCDKHDLVELWNQINDILNKSAE